MVLTVAVYLVGGVGSEIGHGEAKAGLFVIPTSFTGRVTCYFECDVLFIFLLRPVRLFLIGKVQDCVHFVLFIFSWYAPMSGLIRVYVVCLY